MNKTATKTTDRDMALIKAGSLKPGEVLRAADAVKKFVRNHHRRTHSWCWKQLGITKQLFYRFLAISCWSKKVKNLVLGHSAPLSQTALFRFADRKWKDARQLFNKLSQVITYLAQRKRRSLKELKEKGYSKVSNFLNSRKSNPLKKIYEISYMLNGRKGAISTPDPKALNQKMKKIDGYVFLGIRLAAV